ncbi:MAG: DUF6263 family protein, partial [Bacteroidales bacterium]|nr:DUF6263 family protein [Bacteroidales bacterium]
VCLFVLSGCNNKEKYSLEYKFSAGDNFKQRIEMQSSITQSYMGQEMVISSDLTTDVNFDIKEVEKDSFTLNMSYQKMKMDMDMGVAQMTLDSETEQEFATMENMSPMFKAMMGIPMTLVIDNKGNLKSFSGTERLYGAMLNTIQEDTDETTKQQMMAILQQQVSDETFQSTLKNIFFQYPENEIAIGDNWDINTEIKNQGMSLSSTLNLTLKGVEGNIATIACTGTFSTPEGGISQNMNGMTATIVMDGTSEGTILVDMNSGMLTKGDISQNVKGVTTIGDMELPQTIQTKVNIQSI